MRFESERFLKRSRSRSDARQTPHHRRTKSPKIGAVRSCAITNPSYYSDTVPQLESDT